MNAEFNEKHEEWSKAIGGTDRNTIIQQLYRLSWDGAVYRVINTARGLAPPAPDGGVQINPMFHNLLDDCFFMIQAVSIRKLTGKEARKGKRAAYSLRSLVEDMEQNVHLLTRGNLLSLDGFPMDVEPIRQAEQEYIRNKSCAGHGGFVIPPELDADRIEERHTQIDRLCGVNPSKRMPSDVVRAKLFCKMLERLDETKKIATWVNKFVAHAATPQSRDCVKADDLRLTLGHLWRAHEILCRVASILDVWFLNRHSHMFVPSAAYYKFKHIDRPLVAAEGISKLEDAWRSFEEETRQWGEADLTWLVAD
ncbi:MAG: hypothetical protein KAY37_00220 [Phycisphaerae bacterium]|nr:hypothetical protein [Phycisphaerae bacterium]